MQGYVCVNSIYIYLVQDIEADLKPASSSDSAKKVSQSSDSA